MTTELTDHIKKMFRAIVIHPISFTYIAFPAISSTHYSRQQLGLKIYIVAYTGETNPNNRPKSFYNFYSMTRELHTERHWFESTYLIQEVHTERSLKSASSTVCIPF